MSTKASIAARITGTIAAGTYTFNVTDPSNALTLKVDGLIAGSSLSLLRQNYAGNGWELVMDNGIPVVLNTLRRTATPREVGTYTVAGTVAAAVALWSEAI